MKRCSSSSSGVGHRQCSGSGDSCNINDLGYSRGISLRG